MAILTTPTGTVVQNTATLLTFADAQARVLITNESGGIAYVLLNPASGAPRASATVWDLRVDTGEDSIIRFGIRALDVFVTGATVAAFKVRGGDIDMQRASG